MRKLDLVRRLLRLLASDSGQAMTEYALLTAALIFATGFVGLSILPRFIRAFQAYFDSYYVILNLPIP